MKVYLLSAAGVIFLSVVVSLLIPEGKLHKSIMFIMRLICIFVLIQPVAGIFKIGGGDGDSAQKENFIDYIYVSSVYSEHQSGELEKLIKKDSIDMIHAHTIGFDGYLAVKLKKKYYRLKNGDYMNIEENKDLKKMEKLIDELELKKEDLKKEIAIRRERMEKRKLLEYIYEAAAFADHISATASAIYDYSKDRHSCSKWET